MLAWQKELQQEKTDAAVRQINTDAETGLLALHSNLTVAILRRNHIYAFADADDYISDPKSEARLVKALKITLPNARAIAGRFVDPVTQARVRAAARTSASPPFGSFG